MVSLASRPHNDDTSELIPENKKRQRKSLLKILIATKGVKIMLLKLASLIQKRYKAILVVSLLLTVVAMGLASRLKMNMQMQDMLPGSSPQVKSYQDAIDNFAGFDFVTVAIQGDEQKIIEFIENVKVEISKVEHVSRVVVESERQFLLRNGFLLTKKKDLVGLEKMLSSSSLEEFVSGLNDNFEKVYIDSGDEGKIGDDSQRLLGLMNTIEDFVGLVEKGSTGEGEERRIAEEFLVGKRYMIAPDRDLGVIFVKSTLSLQDFEKIIPFVNNLEEVVKREAKKHSVKAGLAGILVLQRDEMEVTEKDSQVSFTVSLIMILLIFWIGFRLFRYTLLSLVPLIMGITWAMGLTAIFVGSLNVFTAMMAAILAGLGIDYAIHIIALFTEERDRGTSVEDSVKTVYSKSAKGIVTGAITTSVGFFMFVLSTFPAFQEFGIVLGLGIICTLVASLFVLPSLLMIVGRRPVENFRREVPVIEKVQRLPLDYPKVTLSTMAVVVALSIFGVQQVTFSGDIKDIEPEGLESLMLNDLMIEKFDMTSDTSIVLSQNIEEARQVKEDLEDLDSVGLVESIASYFPSDKEQKERLAALKRIKKNIPLHVKKRVDVKLLDKELERLKFNLIEISDLSFISGEKKIVDKIDSVLKGKSFQRARQKLEAGADLTVLQATFMDSFKTHVLNANFSEPITLDSLPEKIRDDFIGKDGAILTTVYPKGDVWEDTFKEIFKREISSLDHAVTGNFVLTDEVMAIAGEEGERILVIVILALFIVLLIDLRNIKLATLAMLPMLLTLLTLIGVMGWFGIAFNYLLSSLTTSAAFGTMMLGDYQGFASFGLLLTLGIMIAYFFTVTLVPVLIKITDRRGLHV
jgi:predicted RND superfamily exporter protein